jgi:glutathione S-transferase
VVKLWGRKTSINVQKVMWTLAEAGVPYERIDAGGPFGRVDTPEFQAMNPNKLVPVLDDDGFSLWESNAIVRYLSRKYAGGTLAPADPHKHAMADQWMEWASTGLYGDIISVIFWGLIRTQAAERNNEAIRVSVKRAGERLGVLDEQLSGRAYILGDQLTMADIGVGILMYRYFSLDIERPALPNVRAWHQRLQGRPAYTANAMVDYSSLKVGGA